MQLKSIISLVAGCTLIASTISSFGLKANADEEVRFICAPGFDKQDNQRYPTTYAWTSRGKLALVRWKYPWFNSQNWTVETRCKAVSERFAEAYKNGSLTYITNSWQNKQPVICTARSMGGDCVTMLFTLRPQDDPVQVATQLLEILKGRATGPIPHSSGKPQIYYQINFDKFLQTAPVDEP